MKPIEHINNPHIITDESILNPFLSGNTQNVFADKLSAFIQHQCATWPELKVAREYLVQSLTKKFSLKDLDVHLQHNPHRIKSSSTRVDKEFIEKRPCFLCPDRLYENQKALVYQSEWLILNNPYPIFPDHLVISHNGHLPQDIHTCLSTMIDFVKDLDFSFTAFYNGPACGASAPDHLHFQACPEGGIPITGQLAVLLNKQECPSLFTVLENKDTVTCATGALDNRAFFICVTDDRDFLCRRLTAVVNFLKEETSNAEEPKINLIISRMDLPIRPGDEKKTGFLGIIFPRKAHRPACYFKKDGDLMLVSPGAVDIGGFIILPRREDYERMSRELLLGIFSEVCYGKEIFNNLIL